MISKVKKNLEKSIETILRECQQIVKEKFYAEDILTPNFEERKDK